MFSGNRLLKKVFGPQRDEMTGEWRKLYNEELNDIHDHPYYHVCPDILSLVGDPLSGNGCGSPSQM
jgi:hypothetical protein